MAGITRFITYMYEYCEAEKKENTGFAKIESRGREWRIEIHIRGTSVLNGIENVYLFLVSQQKYMLFPIGEIQLLRGNGDYGTVIKEGAEKELPYPVEKMEGIVVTGQNSEIFMTRWKDNEEIPVQKEAFEIWEKPQTESAQEMTSNIPEVKNSLKEKKIEKEMPQEDLHTMEYAAKNIFPEYSWQDSWERLEKNYPFFYLPGETPIECIRIELKDLKELPGKYWYLGNNSFLLHGFFNYHYLILGKKEERHYFIGVPGIYQKQERVMAAIFGFPEFLPQSGGRLKEENEQTEPINYFGYWYHMLDS